MGILRWCSNLHRGLRLLRRIAATKEPPDLDAVVDQAAAEANERERRVDDLYRKGERELDAVRRRLDKRFDDTAHELRDLSRSVDASVDKLSRELLAQGEVYRQRIEGTCRGTLDEVRVFSQTMEQISQQLAAVRDYAAKQQEQVRRLQEGYDWTVIRGFCLRVIRCLDGVEKRLSDGVAPALAEELEAVRDELLFALEAGGLDVFAPEPGEPFRGQERSVEVVGTEPTEAPERVGRIASVVRNGYVYHADGNTPKLIRTAQVRVFAKAEPEREPMPEPKPQPDPEPDSTDASGPTDEK